MVERSRLEINIRRLLGRCELLAKDDVNIDWKLEMYIESLQDMIEKLQKSPGKPSRDIMVNYIKRVEFLKGVITTKKLPDPVERAVAAQLLPTKIVALNESTDGPSLATQIHQKTTAKYGQEIRNELFQTNSSSGNGLRQRLLNSNVQDQDLDALLKYNRNMQEKIAENMILMTKSMKEHALTASAIIKNDVSTLERSDKLSDNNSNMILFMKVAKKRTY
ncbi:hypothetical protein QAD02_004709 [Eretmocerus hayati]|uniref:Uncharacterized protein n=1 Tax=Eretmocerus hayati TaxID=131215 RepID=A0ACC2NQQ7_9HYME|nr:hypothetical protein QAD02_004709 [Eretmocerus hayati]